MIVLCATPEDVRAVDLLAESDVTPAIAFDLRWTRIACQRAAASVDRARAWEGRGLAWAGDLSVSAAASEAELAWIAAVQYLLGVCK